MRRLLLSLLVFAFTLPVLAQAKHPFTFEDMMKLKRVGEPEVSPDGKWVIFSVVDVDLAANTKTPHIWIVPLQSKTQGPSTAAKDSQANPSSSLGMTGEREIALHGFFADQTYPSLSGTSVARDFVELPSQFNEHWALEPKVFHHYAVNYKTGEPMPQILVDKIRKSQKFNQGYALTEILAAADLDMEWHTIPAGDSIRSVDNFENEALKRTDLDLPQVPPRYRSSYFLHIWANGYASGYYAYLWSEMLDDDAYNWFSENGGMTLANGQRFRDMILSRGNTEDYNKMFYNFRGHKPDIQPMLEDRGLSGK